MTLVGKGVNVQLSVVRKRYESSDITEFLRYELATGHTFRSCINRNSITVDGGASP